MFSTTSVLEPTSEEALVDAKRPRNARELRDVGCALSAIPGQRPPRSGKMIAGIRERAQAFGRAVDAEQRADGGFRVCASLPTGGQS